MTAHADAIHDLAVVVRALARNSGSGCNTQREMDAYREIIRISDSPRSPWAEVIAAGIPADPPPDRRDVYEIAAERVAAMDAHRQTTPVETAQPLVDVMAAAALPVIQADGPDEIAIAWAIMGAFDREHWAVVCTECLHSPALPGIRHRQTVPDGPESADMMCLWDCGHQVMRDPVCPCQPQPERPY